MVKYSDNLTMKYTFFIIILSLLMLSNCASAPKKIEIEPLDQEIEKFVHASGETLPVTAFREIWGYVLVGREADLTKELPLTDVCYFGAEVDMYGALSKVPNRQNLPEFSGKVHLAVTCGNNTLTYFTLMPGSPQRRQLIADLIAATKNYDCLNIDFENIPAKSGDAFLSFMRELRAGLPKEKIFSIALYARTRTQTNDVYDYEKIKPFVDKIFIMAYDEHWVRSDPGSIASLRWCRSVADYSLRAIGDEKLIMGIPFYGRAWEDQNHHRALTYQNTEKIIDTYNIKEIRRENGIPTFDYIANLAVKVYYEDEYSISTRMEMYKSMKINAIGFWRIGQETPKVWETIQIELP
jgi:spore germination protein YaaH